MARSTSRDIQFQNEFTNGVFTAVADLPRAKGGAGLGFGPHELLEAALATCMTMTVQMESAKRGFPLISVECDVTIDRSTPGEAVLNHDLRLHGPLSDEQIGLLREAAARCPVGKTLTGKNTLSPIAVVE